MDIACDSTADFLASTDVVDWYHSDVRATAWMLARGTRDRVEIARRSFEWVRDEIEHSVDFGRPEVTCRASEVLALRTGLVRERRTAMVIATHSRDIVDRAHRVLGIHNGVIVNGA